jgi:putative phosphoesterase
MTRAVSVGVISDTHGLLRPEAVRALRGSDLVLHAGDVGKPEVLDGLRAIAKVVAVRGNNDRGAWARSLPATETLRIGGAVVHLVHDLAELDVDPAAAGFTAVISGHSHRPSRSVRDGVLYLDPGSAGPRRFRLPVAVARLTVRGAAIRARRIELRV